MASPTQTTPQQDNAAPPKWGATASPLVPNEAIRAPGIFMRSGGSVPPMAKPAAVRPPAAATQTRSPFSVVKSATMPPFPVELPAETGALPAVVATVETAGAAVATAPAATAADATAGGVTPAPFAPSGGIPLPTGPVRDTRPMSTAAFVRLIKLCISATIVLGGSYFTIKQAYPVLLELVRPGSNQAQGKDAPVGVKIIQQTRGVVALNNANVDRLNAIINDEFKVDKVDLPKLPERPVIAEKPKPAPEPVVRLDLKALKNSIDGLHVYGVVNGKEPRIIVDGLMVGLGNVVSPTLKLRFVGIDEARHVVLLADDNDRIYRKSY